MSPERVARFAARASHYAAREKARELGVDPPWDRELARRPPRATTRSAAASRTRSPSRSRRRRSPTSSGWRPRPRISPTPRQFADAIHAEFPDQMLAYNLSPSFNWDTTGMSDEEMQQFPEELGKMGFVFNFITYGGHQIDGLAAEEFATALQQDGMLALARLQRKFRLVESPYRTPQTLVGGPRATPRWPPPPGARRRPRPWARAPPSTSTWCRPRCPRSCWRSGWRCGREHYRLPARSSACSCGPHRAGSDVLELGDLRRRRGAAGQRRLRPHQGPARPQHPVGARPEHLRREAAPEAADDADPPVPGAPLQGRRGALRHARPRTTSTRPKR